MITGTWPALVTPFKEDGTTVDWGALERLASRVLGAGSDGLLVLGTIGEGARVADTDRERVIRTIHQSVPDSKVIVSISAGDTEGARRHAQQAADAGAWATMCLPPTARHCDDAEICRHYESVAAAAPIPVILYNHPEVSSGNVVSPSMVRSLRAVHGIVAIKETRCDDRWLDDLFSAADNTIEVIIGPDAEIGRFIGRAASGWMPGSANILPELCVELFRSYRYGPPDQFVAHVHNIAPILALDVLDRGWAALKSLGARRGFPVGATEYFADLTDVELSAVDRAASRIEELTKTAISSNTTPAL